MLTVAQQNGNLPSHRQGTSGLQSETFFLILRCLDNLDMKRIIIILTFDTYS